MKVVDIDQRVEKKSRIKGCFFFHYLQLCLTFLTNPILRKITKCFCSMKLSSTMKICRGIDAKSAKSLIFQKNFIFRFPPGEN